MKKYEEGNIWIFLGILIALLGLAVVGFEDFFRFAFGWAMIFFGAFSIGRGMRMRQ